MQRVLDYFRNIGGSKEKYDPNTMTVRDMERLISLWRVRAEKGNAEDVLRIANESRPFFETMRKKHPAVYDLFKSHHKSLVEIMFEKTTGQKALFD